MVRKGGGGAGGSEIAEMGEVVVSGERVMAVLTGEGGWTVKKRGGESALGEKSGESVLESALRLVGERSGSGAGEEDRIDAEERRSIGVESGSKGTK